MTRRGRRSLLGRLRVVVVYVDDGEKMGGGRSEEEEGGKRKGGDFCGQERPIRRAAQVAAMHNTKTAQLLSFLPWACRPRNSHSLQSHEGFMARQHHAWKRQKFKPADLPPKNGQPPIQRWRIGLSGPECSLHTGVPVPGQQWPDGRQTQSHLVKPCKVSMGNLSHLMRGYQEASTGVNCFLVV